MSGEGQGPRFYLIGDTTKNLWEKISACQLMSPSRVFLAVLSKRLDFLFEMFNSAVHNSIVTSRHVGGVVDVLGRDLGRMHELVDLRSAAT